MAFHQELGAEAVEARTLALAGELKKALAEVSGVKVLSPMDDARSCGLTSFQIEGVAPDEAVSRLWNEYGIVVRQVSELSCVRAATHAFNNEEDLEKLVSAVAELAP